MKLAPTAAVLACLMTCALPTHATLMNADYLAANDAQAVLDTNQGLIWLDLSVSTGWSTSTWSTLVQQNAGWRLASNNEVLNLLIDAFPNITNPDLVGSMTYTSAPILADIAGFSALFGRTWADDTRSYGFYQDEDAIWRMAGVDDFGSNRTLWGGEFSNNYNASAAAGNSVFGMYIVRNAVPEPGTVALLGLGLAGLMSRHRKAR